MIRPVQSVERGITPAMGKAYAFFHAECGAAAIRYELNRMKVDPDVSMPKDLRVFAYPINEMRRNMMVVNNERELLALSAEWVSRGANHFMKMFLPHAANQQVAATMARMFELMALDNRVIRVEGPKVMGVLFRDETGKFVENSQSGAGVAFEPTGVRRIK